MASADSSTIITIATLEDAEAIHLLAVDARIDAWSAADYGAETNRDDSIVLVARQKDAWISGFLVARIVPVSTVEADADLYNIAVSRNMRRAKVGSKLVRTLISIIRTRDVARVWLEVRASNEPAIKFYEMHGFTAELTRRNFYSHPTEDAIVMRLEMIDTTSTPVSDKA